jgi:hypothetical protein
VMSAVLRQWSSLIPSWRMQSKKSLTPVQPTGKNFALFSLSEQLCGQKLEVMPYHVLCYACSSVCRVYLWLERGQLETLRPYGVDDLQLKRSV